VVLALSTRRGCDKFRRAPQVRLTLNAALVALTAALVIPTSAAAHGPVDPAASRYEAHVSTLPPGTQAQVIDGDQRLWLKVDPGPTVVVLDYTGAPYLRFSRGGIDVNQNSAMYYLNQVPPQTPPTHLRRGTPVRWSRVSGGHAYGWHDGRLHALASVALTPGATYVGRWTIPLQVDGASAAIAGGLWHAGDPSPVWFWPILVVLACVAATVRLNRPELDLRLARGLALVALLAFMAVAAGQQLHGRPAVSVGQVVMLAAEVAFALWALRRLGLRRHGWLTFFLVAVAAIWEGASSITVLLDGFVLLALPGFLARTAVVACLAAGIGLLPLVFRMAERPLRGARSGQAEPEVQAHDFDSEDGHAWDAGL
jgi:hypothetical protein